MKKLIPLMILIQLVLNSANAASDTEKKVVMGGLDKGVIDDQIKRYLPQIRYCYVKELNSSAKPISGEIQTRFTIDAAGKVTTAEISSTTLNNSLVETCVVGVIKRIFFPEPVGGGIVDVDYPFVFSPDSKDSKQHKAVKKNEDKSS